MAIEIAPADAGARTNENCSGSVVAILTASGDGNYRVDDGDMLSVLAEYGNDGLGTLADINNDGHVDDADFLIVLQYFGTEY